MSPAAQKLQTLDREAAIKEPLLGRPDVQRPLFVGRESPVNCRLGAGAGFEGDNPLLPFCVASLFQE
jgi:hypothetical protein